MIWQLFLFLPKVDPLAATTSVVTQKKTFSCTYHMQNVYFPQKTKPKIHMISSYAFEMRRELIKWISDSHHGCWDKMETHQNFAYKFNEHFFWHHIRHQILHRNYIILLGHLTKWKYQDRWNSNFVNFSDSQ